MTSLSAFYSCADIRKQSNDETIEAQQVIVTTNGNSYIAIDESSRNTCSCFKIMSYLTMKYYAEINWQFLENFKTYLFRRIFPGKFLSCLTNICSTNTCLTNIWQMRRISKNSVVFFQVKSFGHTITYQNYLEQYNFLLLE